MPYASDSTAGRFMAGDAAAYGTVVRWVARVVASPRFRLLSHEETDLQQEALKRVVEALVDGRFHDSLDFRVYVQSIARYTASAALDRKLTRLRAAGQLAPDLVDRTDPDERIFDREAIARVLAQATEECRQLFTLVFFEQLTYSAVAEQVGIRQGTVKSRMFRCLEKARDAVVRPRRFSIGRTDRPTHELEG